MKNKKFISAAAGISAVMLAGCGENAWNDKLDGFQEPPVYSKTQTINYELTDADYATISGLAANKALATTDEAAAALKAIGTNKCFATDAEAHAYLPAFFEASTFPYFTLESGSTIKATYALATRTPEEVTAINTTTKEYRVTTDEYISAWGSDEDYIEAFAPMNPASANLPGILKSAYPDAVAGDYVLVNYNEATANPIFGSVSGGGETERKLTNVAGTAAVGDELSIKGIVTGISTRGFVVTDESGSICYDKSGFNDSQIAIGAEVDVNGTVSVYNRCLQITGDYTVVGNTDYTYPAPVVYTGSMIDEAVAGTDPVHAQYVQVTASVSISGNYYNFNVDGATKQGSFYNAPASVKDLVENGGLYVLTGYYTSTSSGKFWNLLITDVKAAAPAAPGATRSVVGTTETVGKAAIYQYNGSKWVVPANTIVLQPADYAAMQQKYGNLSGTQPDTFLPTFLNQNYPYAADGDAYVVVYKYYNGSTTAVEAKKFVFENGAWAPFGKTENITEQYNKVNGIWKFDPSVTITLAAGKGIAQSAAYYQACVDWVYEKIDVPLGSTSIKSGIGYVTTYGNNEYYSGTSAYQNNVDLRPSAAVAQYAKGYEGMTDDQIVETMKTRFCYEVFPGALSAMHPDAVAIEGMEVLYTFNFSAYTGTATTEYQVVYKVVGPAKFEFVKCTWWEDGKSPLK